MSRRLLLLFSLIVVLVPLSVAAGCGGDDDESGRAERPPGRGRPSGGGASGSISVMAVWTGAEQANFQAVIDGFTEAEPRRRGQLHVRRRPAADAALDGGRGRQPARHRVSPAAGPHARLRVRGRAPADRLRAVRRRGELRRVGRRSRDGRRDALRLPLQGGQQVDSSGTTSASTRTRASSPPKTGTPGSTTARPSRPPASRPTRSAAPTGGRSPTSSRTSTSARRGRTCTTSWPRTRSPGRTSPSRTRSPRWRRSSATAATSPAGRAARCRRTSRPRSRNVFADPPEGRPGHRGRLRRPASSPTSTDAKPGEGFNVFPFPAIGDSGSVVVGGGDTVVMFKDSPAAQAFIKYLTTPEAAQIWAEKGGFASLNKNLDPSVYPDDDHGDDGGRAGRGRGLPLRPVRPAAGRVRRHGRPGSVQALPGLPAEPGRHRRDHAADGGRRREGVRELAEADERREHHGGAPGLGGSAGRASRGDWRGYALVALGFLAPAIFFLGRLGRLSRRSGRSSGASSTTGRQSTGSSGSTTTRRSSTTRTGHRDQEQRHLGRGRAGARDRDRAALRRLTERVSWSVAFKTVVFMPMAISLFAAGVIWRDHVPEDPDLGAVNAAIGGVKDVFGDRRRPRRSAARDRRRSRDRRRRGSCSTSRCQPGGDAGAPGPDRHPA